MGEEEGEIGHYNFPILRYGAICNIVEDLDLDKAEQIGKQIEEYCKKIAFEQEFIRFIEKKKYKYTFKTPPEIVRPPSIELWEGWVVLTPRLQFQIQEDQNVHKELVSRASIVACMKPNHSKLWVNLFFKGASPQAVGLTRHMVASFFSNYKDLAMITAEFAREIYQQTLCNVLQQEITVDHKQEIVIKAVGSNHPYFIKLSNDIRSGKVINFSDEFRSEENKENLKDFLFFVLNEEIDSIETYERFIEQRKKQWTDKREEIKEKYQAELIEQGGLQWFGLTWGEAVALFAREEFLDKSEISFFGIGAETDKVLKKALKKASDNDIPNVVSRKISRALLESISPFI